MKTAGLLTSVKRMQQKRSLIVRGNGSLIGRQPRALL